MLCILLCAVALGVSAKRHSGNGWSMETPDKVVGREGKRLILFCKFIHPHPDYRGNISIAWKNTNVHQFFNYTNYQIGSKFKNEIEVNEESRYKARGNPRRNDASILIQKLMLKDKDKKIKCRVDLKEKPKDKFELEHGTLIIKDPGTGASPVIGKRGGSAILLPLTYKPKRKNGSSIIIVWTKGNLQEEFTVFNCTCSFSAALPCNVTVNKGGQYELVGRPEQGNASIRVTDLRLNDTSFYFSHIWIWNEGPKLVIQDEIKLEVVVPAAILQLRIVAGDTLSCTAEGVPPVDITWISPGNNTLAMNSSGTRVRRGPERDQITVELLQPSLTGSYHCVAKNQYGRDSREFLSPTGGINAFKLALSIGISSAAVILLLAGFALCFVKKDSHKGQSSVDPNVANDLKSEGAEPVLQGLEKEVIIYSTIKTTAENINQAAPTPGTMDSHDDVCMAIIDRYAQNSVENGEIQAGNSSLHDPAAGCMATNAKEVKTGDVSEDSSDAVIYSTVHIRRRSEVEAKTDPQKSPGLSLYSNVQSAPRAKEETAEIYATVVNSNKQ
ncbi:uncharacterized protein [Narcine bancroftii]|uniref:uncharacterized protein isoform X1 n=1 Tax=Narcine bancroftii TaxID=1343680 RepID=UPI003831EDFF